jgi:hypothetical protein
MGYGKLRERGAVANTGMSRAKLAKAAKSQDPNSWGLRAGAFARLAYLARQSSLFRWLPADNGLVDPRIC